MTVRTSIKHSVSNTKNDCDGEDFLIIIISKDLN